MNLITIFLGGVPFAVFVLIFVSALYIGFITVRHWLQLKTSDAGRTAADRQTVKT